MVDIDNLNGSVRDLIDEVSDLMHDVRGLIDGVRDVLDQVGDVIDEVRDASHHVGDASGAGSHPTKQAARRRPVGGTGTGGSGRLGRAVRLAALLGEAPAQLAAQLVQAVRRRRA